jgi:MYXO-CTERM domain-containing protein
MKTWFIAGALVCSAALLACSSSPEAVTSILAPARARPVRADGLLPGMVRFRAGPPRAAATEQCKNPHLFYFGGPILQSPVILAVFWNSNVNPTIQAKIGQFYADVTLSSYWPWLQEYDTVGLDPGSQVILPGSFGGNFVLVPQRCPASTTGTCALTDAELQLELVRQIGLGVLPPPTIDCTGNVNTLYMVDFPANVSLTGPSGVGKSCNAFCAYHNTGTYGPSGLPLVYGAMMDVFAGGCAEGCGANATPLENATSVHSHELVESVTDPDVGLDLQADYASPAGWADNNNQCGEIADICDDGNVGDTITVGGRSWVVQELWSNKAGVCTSMGPAPPAACSGTTLTKCRACSCGDNGGACNGATPVCDTTSTSAWFGACEESVDAGPAGSEAGTDAGIEASVDAASEAEGTMDAASDIFSDATEGRLTKEAGSDAGGAEEDASMDASEEALDAASRRRDGGHRQDDSGAKSARDSDALDEASPDTDASNGSTVGDNAGCGCRIAEAPSSASPAFFGFGALALVGSARWRRKRGARS